MTKPIPAPEDAALDWREFLTDRPPGTRARIDRPAFTHPQDVHRILIATPELRLYCAGKCKSLVYCKGETAATGRLFCESKADPFPPRSLTPEDMPQDAQVRYFCEKCGHVVKSYSVRFWNIAASVTQVSLVDIQKIAEWPPFSPRTPGKVMSLVGPDGELFLRGRRAEIAGLGVGAFSYYRRIIETQKNRLLDAIIRGALHLGAPADTITVLEEAKRPSSARPWRT